MKKKLYTLTDEHRAQLKPWADKWIANAMSTKAMTADEKMDCVKAVHAMYASAGKKSPRVVFAPSPFVARFAAGFASAIWWMRKNPNSPLSTRAATDAATRAATRAATDAATYAATYAATHAATYDATNAATHDATDAATYDATNAATYDATNAATDAATNAATHAATRAATDAATNAATHAATYDATDAATNAATNAATRAATRAATYDATNDDHSRWFVVPNLSKIIQYGKSLAPNLLALQCAQNAWKFYQGGNMWSGWSSYLTFFRYVAKLPIDYSKFDSFEYLSEHSGIRFVHEEFCIISDRPEVLKVDEQNRPHCDNGPFCRWRDGTELYSLHGVRLPAHYVLRSPHEITSEEIMREENVDIRRELIRKVGIENIVASLPHEVLDKQGNYELLKIDFPGLVQDTRYLKMLNPSIDVYHLEGVERSCNTVQEAINWRAGDLSKDEAWQPSQLT